jgi:hypothetical protein
MRFGRPSPATRPEDAMVESRTVLCGSNDVGGATLALPYHAAIGDERRAGA